MSITTTPIRPKRKSAQPLAAAAPAAAIAVTPDAAAQTVAAPQRRARIALLGASGYAGQEFARLAIGHPGLDLVALCSREHAGRPVSEVLPGIDSRLKPLPPFVDPATVEALLDQGEVDTLVVSLPHGAWTALVAEVPELERRPASIVDLSSDRRDGSRGYVYGLPEAFRLEIAKSNRIANPGCYPTAATLALLPAIEADWLAGPIMVSALSGVSGAGRSPSLRTSFVELDGGAAIYRAGDEHQHVPEMARNFRRVAGHDLEVGFTPQLAPMARGILLTATAPLARAISPDEAYDVYRARFADEPFVRVLEPSQWPETRSVRTSNRCDVRVATLHGGRTLLATAALDNLVKGAAGQAIQNLNLLLGWPEAWGLPVHGTPW